MSRISKLAMDGICCASTGLTVLQGCNASSPHSEPKLVNGIEITAETIPAVVKIEMEFAPPGRTRGFCTATWVSDRTLLTSAHCLLNAGASAESVRISDGLGAGNTSKTLHINPNYDARLNTEDLAVIVFPDKTIDPVHAVSICDVYPQVNDPVTLVGYAPLDSDDAKPGFHIKRMGSSRIANVKLFIEYVGLDHVPDSGTTPGSQVMIQGGDSGGPMFLGDAIDGKIIGVASYTVNELTPDGLRWGAHTNVRAYMHLDWFLTLKEHGARINGL